MATEKTEVILDFKVETGDALAKQEALKASMIELKKEQQELNKAYKANQITLQEYAEASTRVENNLKRTTSEHNNLQRAVTGVKNPMKDLAEQFKKNAEGLKGFAENVERSGLEIGGLTKALGLIVSPAGAAAAAIGALGVAYVESAKGEEDMKRATDQFRATFAILSNDIGNAVGESGPLTKLSEIASDIFINLVNPMGARATVATKNALAENYKTLRELEVDKIEVDKNAAERLTKAFDLREIRDTKEKYSLQERANAAKQIVDEIELHASERIDILNKQIKLLVDSAIKSGDMVNGHIDKENKINILILTLQKQIAEISAENGRRLDQARKQEVAITDELTKQAQLRSQTISNMKKGASSIQKLNDDNSGDSTLAELKASESQEGTPILDKEKEDQRNYLAFLKEIYGEKKDLYIEDAASYEKLAKKKKDVDDLNLGYAGQTLAAFSSLAKKGTSEQKILASAAAIIATYETAEKAASAVADVPYAGPALAAAAAAAAIATGLANVAQINGVSFSIGGYTGSGGVYEPAGIVHKGEVVWSQRDVAMAGGPSVVNSMRPTYYDGGVVAGSATHSTDAAIMQSNMTKNIPNPVLGIREFSKVYNRVIIKEQTVRI